MTARAELRELILASLNGVVTESGRRVYVTRRLEADKLVIQRARIFESDDREPPLIVTVKPAPDALRMRDRAIAIPAEVTTA